MDVAAHVAAAGLDAMQYARATHPADRLFMEAVAVRARDLRVRDIAAGNGLEVE